MCACEPNPNGGFPLKFCERHLPRVDPAAIGLDYGQQNYLVTPLDKR